MSLQHSDLVKRYPQLASIENQVVQAVAAIEKCFKAGGKLITFGNGGSFLGA